VSFSVILSDSFKLGTLIDIAKY